MIVASLLGVGGCSHRSDGSSVSVEPNGITKVTDANGNSATILGNGQQITIKEDKGASTVVANDGVVKSNDEKGNSLEVGTGVSESDLGVPTYPGSTDTKNSMKSHTAQDATVMSVRETADAPDKVLAFYIDKLGKPASQMTSDALTMGTWKDGKRSIMLMIGKPDPSTKIDLTVVTKT